MKDSRIYSLAKQSCIPIEPLDERKATSWVEGNAAHQGVVAFISLPNFMISFEKWLEQPKQNPVARPQPSQRVAAEALVLLNEVQDPHNVGAVIRSAAAFGASAILMPTAKQAPVTSAVIKASAGMAFTVPLVFVQDIPAAVSELRKRGFRTYGLAGEGKNSLPDEPFDAPALFIMGNESKGLPQKTAQMCDRILSIPIEEKAESLNVAAAAAITLYQWHTKNRSNS